MEPIIYMLPISDKIIDLKKSDVHYEDKPSPKLIKYGFNTIIEQLDITSITNISQYRAALSFDFENNNEDNISAKLSVLFESKNIDITFAEFWEMIMLFGLLKGNQNIYTSHPKTMENIVDIYQKMSQVKNNYTNNGKSPISLVIFKYADSNIDIDENVGIQLLSNNLTKLLEMQTKEASMILQLFGLQTQTTIEFIYYLNSLYTESYLIKPIVISELSNSSYLVLKGLKNTPSSIHLPLPPKTNKNDETYLISIGLSHIPNEIVNIVQCMNSIVIPLKYNKYNQIKEYLNTKVYEGSTYQEMLRAQYKNTDSWIEIFTNLKNMEKILDNSIKKSVITCGNYSQLIELLK